MHIISIDIGHRNLAVLVKEFSIDDLSRIPRIDSNLRFNINTNQPMPSYIDMINRLHACGKIVYFNKICFTEIGEVHKSTEISNDLLRTISRYILTVPHITDTDSHILLEDQYSKNHVAIRIQHHIDSTLINMNSPKVHRIHSLYKTKLLGAPKKMTPYQRKKWAYQTASHAIFTHQFDIHSKMYKTYNKDHADISDAYLQMVAWLILHLFDTIIKGR